MRARDVRPYMQERSWRWRSFCADMFSAVALPTLSLYRSLMPITLFR